MARSHGIDARTARIGAAGLAETSIWSPHNVRELSINKVEETLRRARRPYSHSIVPGGLLVIS